ncbi:type II toxin-antitoxin system HigB family toxin, partial [Pseudomonas lurida]|uniref:type II toxin-antitoxin system HigB family toxin n=1 Tax=Pseudomonas lurida TaxID=244566 RepID=UPI0034D980E4
PEEMRKMIPSLNNFKYRDKWWVIVFSGNTLRIIAFIDFQWQKIFIKHITTHADYDKLSTYYREHKQ